MINNKIYRTYQSLLKKHGEAKKLWPQWCAKRKSPRDRDLIAIGAILTQRTSWRNADIALRNLKKKNLLSLKEIAVLSSPDKLIELVRPAGFYQTKPKRLYSFASFIVKEYGNLVKFIGAFKKTPDLQSGDELNAHMSSSLRRGNRGLKSAKDVMKEGLDIARNKLLGLYGIGPETADTILLYALDRPSFVIDEYTKRFVSNHLSLPERDYDRLKKLFEKNLPKQVEIYQNYHTLIIVEQKGREGSLMKVL